VETHRFITFCYCNKKKTIKADGTRTLPCESNGPLHQVKTPWSLGASPNNIPNLVPRQFRKLLTITPPTIHHPTPKQTTTTPTPRYDMHKHTIHTRHQCDTAPQALRPPRAPRKRSHVIRVDIRGACKGDRKKKKKKQTHKKTKDRESNEEGGGGGAWWWRGDGGRGRGERGKGRGKGKGGERVGGKKEVRYKQRPKKNSTNKQQQT